MNDLFRAIIFDGSLDRELIIKAQSMTAAAAKAEALTDDEHKRAYVKSVERIWARVIE